ncbi:MAG: hypothetical protein DHS20C06_15990 [Hyphobacterium sp.]|nr:MAG: hypothetical protein DHS20C06_15990 [Hyphobacterium sp.]
MSDPPKTGSDLADPTANSAVQAQIEPVTPFHLPSEPLQNYAININQTPPIPIVYRQAIQKS